MNEKQKKRLAAIQRQQALVDAAKNGKRQLTAEEEAEVQTLQREIDRLATEIAAEEEQQRSLGGGGGTPPTPPTPPVTPPAPTGGQDEGQRQIEAERTRTLNITTMCRDFGLEDTDLQRFIKDGSSEDQVRAPPRASCSGAALKLRSPPRGPPIFPT